MYYVFLITLGGVKKYNGYKAYDFLESGFDFHEFKLVKHPRVEPYYVPLSKTEEERFQELVEKSTVVDLHEHPVLYPEDMKELPELDHLGRQFTAYEALSTSHLDCVFDNMMDGMTYITSFSGWKFDDIVHDLGIRLSDLAHQDMIVHCKTVKDIREAKKNGKIALVFCMESATPIENELDRIDVLYGLGVRSMGICYSESNMLGGGMSETYQDTGLTDFGYDAVKRMNKLRLLIDIGHTNDRTALETIEASDCPIYDSHSGPAAIAQGHIKGDEVLKALAEHDGVLGVGGAGQGLRTKKHPVGSIESYMECVEYCIDLMGIDHVGCGPDTLYGAHQKLYEVWFPRRMGHYDRLGAEKIKSYPVPDGMVDPGYVKGMENPNEFINVMRWMIKHGYSDPEIQKIIGGNAMKLLKKVWR
ncbi:MAG TPA: diguanylate cyclase [Candidatus Bathyarchaeota archaeon]|nr:diguanylate cyclase [Candidatus Bathyarchaeota archaeon]